MAVELVAETPGASLSRQLEAMMRGRSEHRTEEGTLLEESMARLGVNIKVGVRTQPTFKPAKRHETTRKAQNVSDKQLVANEKKWMKHHSNKPGWHPPDRCQQPGCKGIAVHEIMGCARGRRVCETHALRRCEGYECTCKIAAAKARIAANQAYADTHGSRLKLSERYEYMSRTRPKGARIRANLEGKAAIYMDNNMGITG